MARPLYVNEQLTIPAAEFQLSFARSGGPGGQNVNKVNSKAVLRWNVAASESLPAGVKERFLASYISRISGEGEIIIAADRHRDQPQNTADCYARLRELIAAVWTAPRRRKKTRPSRGSVERRLESKRQRSQRKSQRRPPPESS